MHKAYLIVFFLYTHRKTLKKIISVNNRLGDEGGQKGRARSRLAMYR